MFKNGARTSPRGDQASRHVRGIVAGAARVEGWKLPRAFGNLILGCVAFPVRFRAQPCKFGKDKTAFVMFDFKKQQ
jgi:hypothetical protein